jgi:type IV fimbrial biogenesis protein FimT
MLIQRKQGGFSLIEMMIGIVIVSLLLVVGVPSFSLWMQNTQTRAAAESILNGLQIARVEAWTVTCVTVTVDCPAGNIQSRNAGEGGTNARAGVAVAVGALGTPLAAGAGLPTGVTFNGLGRVPAANIGTDIARVDITNAAAANARRMVILVSSAGQARMCDPALAIADNPQGCA